MSNEEKLKALIDYVILLTEPSKTKELLIFEADNFESCEEVFDGMSASRARTALGARKLLDRIDS